VEVCFAKLFDGLREKLEGGRIFTTHSSSLAVLG
jgi:hypothetical protein